MCHAFGEMSAARDDWPLSLPLSPSDNHRHRSGSPSRTAVSTASANGMNSRTADLDRVPREIFPHHRFSFACETVPVCRRLRDV
jgi:hypothetical protein